MALVGFLISIVLAAGSAVLYAPSLGRRGAVAAALLQATTLPFIVAATQIGAATGRLSPLNAAALVCAGLLSVVLFPPIALGLLRTSRARRAGRATEQPAYQYSERM